MHELTMDDFQSTIGSGLTVVDFWAPWCAPCKMFAPIFEQSAQEHPEVKFAKLNTDAHPEIAQQLGIRGIPTLIFFRDGQEVSRVSGAMPKMQFETELKDAFS
jgi:thioredoxin